ncbi:hypothetical protein E4O05_00820 [Treponema sp. OMZ 787]|nr:hypothetical protein E4O05_00820 [Treponema sp. OMZ 787]
MEELLINYKIARFLFLCYNETMNTIRKMPIGVQSFEVLRKENYKNG